MSDGEVVMGRKSTKDKAAAARRAESRSGRATVEGPDTLRPMLATAGDLPSADGEYGYEFKWDGARCLVFWDGTALILITRNGIEVTERYPELAGLGEAIGSRSAVLDGEIVALDDAGRPSFPLLQRRLHLRGAADVARVAAQVPVALFLFDILALDGRSLMELPYPERRSQLESLRLNAEQWTTPPWFRGRGGEVLAAADLAGLEGIVAKRLDSRYRPGARSDVWLKVKVRRREEFVVAGYVPGKGTQQGRVGSLLLGYYTSPTISERTSRAPLLFRFAGHVGTGMSDAERADLKRYLDLHSIERNPFDVGTPAAGAVFSEPRLIAEIAFHEWTLDGILRHPVYLGLREDKSPREVRLEEPPVRRAGHERQRSRIWRRGG